MTVIPGTPGTYMDLQKRKNRGEIQRDVNRGFSRKIFYASLVCAIFTYIIIYLYTCIVGDKYLEHHLEHISLHSGDVRSIT